ncbi:MAG: hypothetical protein HON94_13980 [Methylococcales bacterium]|nr:hypothetical protein [Methylococcales bacterium]MBT7408355.1 hypothetical protein [Methylococcales bacterium]
MVILEPINQNFKAQPRTSKTHQIKMTHKEFIPGYKIIQTGDKVNFSNLESFKHNVFSSSQGNQFDLGSYTQHNQNKVKTWQQFNSSGLVKIYCNIHGQMAAFVYVSNSPFFALTDSDGKFEINQIPAGRYQLLAWNVRGEMKKQIEIIDDKNQSINLLLDYSSYIKKPHFNKNNQTYPVINENEYDSSYEDF